LVFFVFFFLIHLLIWFFFQFYHSIQDFCVSSQFIFSNEALILLIAISLFLIFFYFIIRYFNYWDLVSQVFSIVYKPYPGVNQGQWSGHESRVGWLKLT
jgi:hypothetical protein